MKFFKRHVLIAVTVGIVASSTFANDKPADIIVINADIRTVDAMKPRAYAMAVRDGKFLAVGSQAVIERLKGADTKVIDAQGRTVTPGFTDAHTHFLVGTDLMRGVDLYDVADRKQWAELIKKKEKELKPGEWLVGGRWDVTLTDSEELPNRQQLDLIIPDRPVVLTDADFHSIWVNSKAMELAGVTADTPDPEGGEIVRDKNGQPTGIFKENAIDLIYLSKKFVSAQPPKAQAMRDVIRHFNSLGVTSAHDMWPSGLDTYREMLKDGQFSMRVWFGLMANTERSKSGPKQFIEYAKQRDDINAYSKQLENQWGSGPQFRFGYMKYFVDGVLSTYTAALDAPYADRHDHFTGHTIFDKDRINALVKNAHDAGFPVAIHAIGDRAVDMAFDAFASSPASLPDRIEHVEVIQTEAIPRFAELGVYASMQPNHAIHGSYIPSRLGEPRMARSYAWQSLLSNGAKIVFGSDWPTALEVPMHQLGDAVLRERDGKSWHGENAMSLDEALYAYTQGPANIAGWGDQVGSVTVGKWADFVILDGTLSEPVDKDIRNMKVAQTWFAGKQVYSSEKQNK